MLTKTKLQETLERFLADRDVLDADELAYDFVEYLDEEGEFENDEVGE